MEKIKYIYLVNEKMYTVQNGTVVEIAFDSTWRAFSSSARAQDEARGMVEVQKNFYSKKYDREPSSSTCLTATWEFGDEPTWVYGYSGGYIPWANSVLRYEASVSVLTLDWSLYTKEIERYDREVQLVPENIVKDTEPE